MKRGQATTVDRHSAGHEIGLFLPLEDRSYWVGTEENGNRQFVVADPDGHLLRFL